MAATLAPDSALPEPTDFGGTDYASALVNVTNVCNLSC